MLISLNKIFKFIINTCHLYKIDESHGVRHSMDILRTSKNIIAEEYKLCSYLHNKEYIIYTSALLHDMCDDKYFKNDEGQLNVINFLKDNSYMDHDIDVIMRIINTISYSKVKKYGFQFKEDETEEFKKMYHIVREADVLCAYEVERCILYDLHMRNNPFTVSYKRADELFQIRMFKHFDDNLFTTIYALREYKQMHKDAEERLSEIKNLIESVDNGEYDDRPEK
jgi:HD superfamily phosphodiesterase